jgi:hypothetical protein
MPILGVIASSNYQRVAPDTGAMFPLGMVQVGSAGASTISFTSIPATYKHLQIRALARSTQAEGVGDFSISYNSDTTNGNYAYHRLIAEGTTVYAQGSTSSRSAGFISGANNTSGVFSGVVIEILDYASTSKNKTLRTLNGYDNNGSGWLGIYSNLWINSSTAISSISFTCNSNFAQYTQFALYGIKGA